MGRRWQIFRLFIFVVPLAGLAVLSSAALVLNFSAYRPRGDVLASGAFGLVELIAIYVTSFMPGALMGIVAASLPKLNAWAKFICLMVSGVLIGLSPLGWWLSASMVPPGNNSLVLALTVLASLLVTLISWHFSRRLDKAHKAHALQS